MQRIEPPPGWATIATEALARNARFQREVVEAHGFCPYARPAREAGTMARVVLPHRAEALTVDCPTVSAALDRFLREPALEVMQVIFPRVEIAPRDWEQWAKRFTARWQADRTSVVAVAAFHPELPLRGAAPERYVALLRRTPDPTIQWLRLSVLAAVRGDRAGGDRVLPEDPHEALTFLRDAARPSLAAAIAERNARVVDALGEASLAAVLGNLRSESQR